MSFAENERSPSLPSYPEIGPAPPSLSPLAPSEKFASKIEKKTFTIDIEAQSQSETSEEQAATSVTKPSFLFRLIESISLWGLEWGPFLLLVTYLIVSVFLYIVLPKSVIQVFWFFYMASNFYIAGNTVIEACLSLAPIEQARKAVKRAEQNDWAFPTNTRDLPMIDIMIVAYLPNEKDIIMDRTLYAVQKIVYPTDRIRINIVYNTPKPMPELQKQLHDLTAIHSNLRVMQVPNSHSKADNVNHFLSLNIQTDVIAIFDCDHYPHPYGPRWAAERFCQSNNVDVVQGRCVVFNAATSFLTSMIAVEFDKIYAVSHPGRAEMWQFGLFCGSNGYWKGNMLREIGMDGSMLTEDIDSALRALGRNVNVVHEINAVSYELAPTTYQALRKQRLRWAQGWTQASIKHAKLAWNNPEQGNRKTCVRAGIVSILVVRELSYYLVSQYTCLVISFLVVDFPKSPSQLARLVFFQFPISEWFFIISFVTLIMTLAITYHVRSEFVTILMMIEFSILYPFYLVVGALIGVYGHARELTGYSSWNPTSRA